MKRDFTLGPVADYTIGAFEIARGEGWYALDLVAQNDEDSERAAFNLRDALDRADGLGDERYDRENEMPFVSPDLAIRALRLALRALVAPGDAMATRMAIEAIGHVVIGVEVLE